MRAIIAAILLTSLAGCVDPPSSVDCGSDQEHPFEGRCLDGTPVEHCQIWLADDARRSDTIFCTVTTDGAATVDVQFSGSGSIDVYVWKGDELLAEHTATGDARYAISGAAGEYRLAVDLRDAVGPLTADLWG